MSISRWLPRRREPSPSAPSYGTITAVDPEGRKLAWTNGQWSGHPDLLAEALALVGAGARLVAFEADGLTVDAWLYAFGAPTHYYTVYADMPGSVAVVAVMSVVCGPGVVLTGNVPDYQPARLDWADITRAAPVENASGIAVLAVTAVDQEGRSLVWSNTQWSGHPDLVAEALHLANANPWLFEPGAVELVAAVAVMSVACGPGVVLRW